MGITVSFDFIIGAKQDSRSCKISLWYDIKMSLNVRKCGMLELYNGDIRYLYKAVQPNHAEI